MVLAKSGLPDPIQVDRGQGHRREVRLPPIPPFHRSRRDAGSGVLGTGWRERPKDEADPEYERDQRPDRNGANVSAIHELLLLRRHGDAGRQPTRGRDRVEGDTTARPFRPRETVWRTWSHRAHHGEGAHLPIGIYGEASGRSRARWRTDTHSGQSQLRRGRGGRPRRRRRRGRGGRASRGCGERGWWRSRG